MAESFGGYTLLEKIGVGGMAEVFLARRNGVEGFEKDIVIKRIRPHLSEIPSFVNMFLAEAKLAARLSHPHIVQIYDLGKIKDSYFIAMEYVAGRDISAVIPKARQTGIPFPVEYALKVASSVCEALYYAHTQTDGFGVPLHVVHRDLSPENIRVAWTGTVKILDFGIAKAATQLRETKSGEIKGKVSYMSPEQVLGNELDHRSDIFSLGVVLYECITGLQLFAGESDMAIMQNILEGKIYPPSYYRDDVPEGVEQILMKALARDKKKRYDSAIDMQFDIDAFLSKHEFTPSSIHLSNFLKQLFKDELEAELQRRRATTAPPKRTPRRPPPLPGNTAGPAPASETSEDVDFDDGHTTEHDAPAVATVPPPPPPPPPINTEVPLLVQISADDLRKLRGLAMRRGVSIEAIVNDFIAQYLKYVE